MYLLDGSFADASIPFFFFFLPILAGAASYLLFSN
jgi:hypothetical protein